MKLKFLGACGIVTGSSYLLSSQPDSILIDLGMFQGPDEIDRLNYLPLEFNPSQLCAAIVTHAHLDHCGRLPLLTRGGFNKKIFMTPATRELISLTLFDSVSIAERNKNKQILYTFDDVKSTLKLVEVVEYGQIFNIGGFSCKFYDAGHILGSASVEVFNKKENKRIIFSGDIGNFPEPLMKPTEFIPGADIVVMETTYGDRTHPNENPEVILQEEINAVENSKAALLIPAFSLERTQVLLHMINHLKSDNKILAKTKVFLDSPMAISATSIYLQHRHLFNNTVFNHAKSQNPFQFKDCYFVDSHKRSKRIKNIKDAKVIIAGSGMMVGGRIVGHSAHFLPDPATRLLIVGFMAEQTMGREIKEGAKKVTINKKSINIRAKIREISSLSAHADSPKLIKWLSAITGANKIFLTHGEQSSREAFVEKIRNELGIHDIVLPAMGEEVYINAAR